MKTEITKEQAEAIEFLREGYTDSSILQMYVEDDIGLMKNMFGHDCGSLYDLDLIELATALINGYEIGKPPEEQIHEYYVEALHTARDETTGHDIQDAIRYTLETLGIKIEGVNGND
ncbi:hypothetical protein ACRPLG_02495 [Bacillus safensis]|uniref:hypothetical protein n=1 Tax=Bacillus safensis TaxID=561879 RepID=UPI003D7866F7